MRSDNRWAPRPHQRSRPPRLAAACQAPRQDRPSQKCGHGCRHCHLQRQWQQQHHRDTRKRQSPSRADQRFRLPTRTRRGCETRRASPDAASTDLKGLNGVCERDREIARSQDRNFPPVRFAQPATGHAMMFTGSAATTEIAGAGSWNTCASRRPRRASCSRNARSTGVSPTAYKSAKPFALFVSSSSSSSLQKLTEQQASAK